MGNLHQGTNEEFNFYNFDARGEARKAYKQALRRKPLGFEKNKYVSETTVIIQNISMTSLLVFPFPFYFTLNVFLFSLAKCGLRKL